MCHIPHSDFTVIVKEIPTICSKWMQSILVNTGYYYVLHQYILYTTYYSAIYVRIKTQIRFYWGCSLWRMGKCQGKWRDSNCRVDILKSFNVRYEYRKRNAIWDRNSTHWMAFKEIRYFCIHICFCYCLSYSMDLPKLRQCSPFPKAH